jgi:3-hydroxyacyl-[acyl-carrier-protein] dehydratase
MDREKLMKILPHRDGMLLVDEAYVSGGAAYGKYTVRGDEWFLKGHFPEFPVVPGVVLCEILAQSACVLFADRMTGGKLPVFTGLDRVRFKNMVRPGDTLETECRMRRSKPPFFFAEGTGTVGGKVCVTAEFSFAMVEA